MSSLFATSLILVSAALDSEKNDARINGEGNLADFKIGNTVTVDDGYIGIPVELSIFFDKSNHQIKSGYGGTNVIIYVINTMVERIGTDGDTDIIRSMLDRGYVVVVLDYLNNKKATSPELDWSVQNLREKVKNKEYFTDSIFPSGIYYDNYIVPAGYDVSLNNVFWEADKHGTEGSLEKIVEVWNNDFKGVKGNTLVKWVHADGTRKKVENAKDGTAPQWYNVNGSADANGEYTKVKWTVAEVVTDCVKPDGTSIDLNQYITLIYPTNPEQSVPVMAIANSGGSMATATQQADRPHFNGFLFDGYAGVVFDYLWIPMGRDDAYGYFDGSFEFTEGAVTGDQMTYSLHIYNDTKIYTAAMRYIRYMALSDSDTYSFDVDKIGVFGNSKGGWATFLGEEVVQSPTVKNPEAYATLEELEAAINANVSSFTDKRFFVGHHGETRYDVGNIEAYAFDGVTIDGGEKQPWLTYNGQEIISGATALYLSNGHGEEFINDGHVPTLVISHIYDYLGAPYGITNKIVNLCRNHDIASLFFEVPLDHTLTSGIDLNHGVDTYEAVYAFFGYYLKDESVSVVYTTPKNSAPDVYVKNCITIKFTGPVDSSEITAIVLKDSSDNIVNGSWSAEFGNTEWTFSPEKLEGSETYTVTIPATLKGENGKAIGNEYSFSFNTEYDSTDAPASVVSTSGGYYVTFPKPSFENGENRFVFRFKVTNDAANVAQIYAVSSFDANLLDRSQLGEMIGSANLSGSGYYEIDITEYILGLDGESVTVLLTAKNSLGEFVITNDTFETGINGATIGKYSDLYSEKAPGGTNALKVVLGTNEGRYVNNTFYAAMTEAFTYSSLIKNGNLDESDYGRRFTVSMKIYDTASRVLQIKLSPCTNKYNYTMDYDMVIHNVITKANEWLEFSFDYVVYDMDYGVKGGMSQNKALIVEATTDGCTESPVYFDDIKVIETVTGIDAEEFAIAAKSDALVPYRAPESECIFTIHNGSVAKGSYNSFSEAISNYTATDIIKLNSDYTLTDEDVYTDMTLRASAVSNGVATYVIDLNGYTVRCENKTASLIVAKTTGSSYDMSVTILNGAVLIGDTPLVSYIVESAKERNYVFEFEGVSFGVIDGAFSRTYMSERTISLSAKTNVSMTVNDCVYDIPNSKIPANTFVLFPYGEGNLELSYEIFGGEIRIDTQRWVSAYDKIGDCLFKKNGEGVYTSLVMPACEHMFEQVCLTDGGYFVFAEPVDSVGYSKYALTEISRSTKYGLIPEAYESIEDYPFALFDTEGNFIVAAALLGRDKGGSVLSQLTDGTQGEWYILLRRDYVYREEQFNNLALIYGTVTIDLNDHVFSCEQTSGRVFDFYVKKGNKTVVNIINGTINTGKLQLVKLYSGTTSSYDGQNKKTLEFNFEDIKFNIGKASSLVTYGSANVAFNAGLSFTDCVFDMTDVNSGFSLIDIGESSGNMACKVEFSGGEFISDNFDGVKLYNPVNSNSEITFAKNKAGEYSKAVVNEGGKAPTDILPTEEGRMMFGSPVTSNGITTYELSNDAIDVEYGLIPSDFASESKYPFAVFKDGAFIGAYTTWKDAITSASEQVKGNSAKGQSVTMLLRSDYNVQTGDTFDNLCDIGGTLVIDLGGKSLIRSASLFQLIFQKINNVLVTETNINIKNGKLLSYNSALFTVLYLKDEIYKTKTFNITLDNVDIGFAEGATANTPLFQVWDNSRDVGGGNVNFEFNNCEFDLKTNAPSGKTLYLFNFYDKYNLIKVTAEVNGGVIKANTLSNVKINNIDKGNDEVRYNGQSDGSYTTLQMPVGASTASLSYNTDNGVMYFGKVSTDGKNDYYELISPITEYGTIDVSKISPVDYPFAVFKDDAFIGAYTTWKDAITSASEQVKGNSAKGQSVTMLLRSDYNVQTGDTFDNLCDIGGTLVIDLGGKSLIRSASLFQLIFQKINNVLVTETNINIKNGKLLSYNSALFTVLYLKDEIYKTKTFNITLDNVDIGFAEGATANTPLFQVWDNSRDVGGGNVNFEFNNCEFDLKTNAPSGKTLYLFNFYDKYNLIKVTAEVNGGVIKANTLSNVKINNIDKGNDEVRYNGQSDGSYTTLQMPVGASTASLSYNTDNGVMYFGKVSTDGINDYYELISLSTEYGMIGAAKASPLDYPFAVFKDGAFVEAYGSWAKAAEAAIDLVKGNDAKGKTVTILLRRDYNVVSGDTVDTLCDIGGTLVLDLNNYTITRSASFMQFIFDYTDKTNRVFVRETNIVIKNGTLLANNASIITSVYINDNAMKDKTFNVTFDNVDIGFASGAAATNPLVTIWDNNRNCQSGTINITLNDCDIDLKTNAPAGKTVILFNFYDKYGAVSVNATVNGGNIISDILSNVKINSFNDAGDSVVYGKAANGNYTCLVLKKGVAAPAAEFPLAKGRAVFVKIAENNETVTYRLRPVEIAEIEFTPKMSLTLDRDLVLNVYVPNVMFLNSFAVDGKASSEYAVKIVTLDDGIEYYVVSVPLSASEAARDVILSANVTIEDKTATGTFKFSTIKYAEQILIDGTDAEKTLVKDVLSYIRAAYAYFNIEDAAAITKIDAILGENYDENNAPIIEGSTARPSTGLYSVTLVLDETPSMRFYLAAGADAKNYKFYINGYEVKTLSGVSGDYTYVDILTYAYEVCESVSYKIYDDNGEVTGEGSLHINAYYAYVSGNEYTASNKAELLNLTARFWKYCQSARTYRYSVVND